MGVVDNLRSEGLRSTNIIDDEDAESTEDDGWRRSTEEGASPPLSASDTPDTAVRVGTCSVGESSREAVDGRWKVVEEPLR